MSESASKGQRRRTRFGRSALSSALLCGEFEASDGAVRLYGSNESAHHARLLLLDRGEPVGYFVVPLHDGRVGIGEAERAAGSLRAGRAERSAGPTADRRPGPSQTGPPQTAPHVTVVICTRNRAAELTKCLASLAELLYDHVDFLVVDNAAEDSSTFDVVARLTRMDPRYVYAAEPVPGLSRARNTGLQLAVGDIVAYTDDDVQVSPDWINGLITAFHADARVKCVTGLVPSQQITTDYERFFERRYTAWWSRLDPRTFDPDHSNGDRLFPFAAGQFGTGANFAVDRATATSLGGFDVALGAGTPTGGGEDLDYFCRNLLAGHSLRYQPSAIVWHAHRSRRGVFLTQVFRYGCGSSSYVTKLLRQRVTRRRVARMIPAGMARLLSGMWGARHSTTGAGLPWLALTCELLGYAWGPFAYWSSVLAQRSEQEKVEQ